MPKHTPILEIVAQSSQKMKNAKKSILKEYGKLTPWILYMYVLTYDTKC